MKKSPFIISEDEKMLNSSTKFNNEPNAFKSSTNEEEKKITQRKIIPTIDLSNSVQKKKPNTPTFQGKNISFMNKSSNNNSNNSRNSNLSITSNSFCTVNQVVSNQVASAFPDLLIEETEGHQLNGEKVIVTPAGLRNSPRNKRDGFVFFGSAYENEKNEIINDVILTSGSFSNSNTPHYFVIYFNLSNEKYFIRPFSNSQMSFLVVKLNSIYRIHNKEYLIFSDFIFMINIDHSDNSLLITKVPTKTSQEEIEYRYPPEYGKVTIGRDKNCTISFSINKNLSKVNTTIFFNSDEKSWYVSDGGELPSLNGTWIMLRHSYEIYDGLEFKAVGNSKFKIHFVQKK